MALSQITLLFPILCLGYVLAYPADNATDFRAYCGRNQCPDISMCGVEWNKVPGGQVESCCPGFMTERGCQASGCGKSVPCLCNSLVNNDLCSARASKSCPTISSVQLERQTNLQTGLRITQELKNQVDAQGVDANQFFTFLMNAYEQAYQKDTANLVAFQALMEQKDPPPPNSVPLDMVFEVFKKLLELLPVGDEIKTVGWAIMTATDDALSLSTNSDGKTYHENIEWQDFLMMKALSIQETYQQVTNGLWNYTQAYWKSHNVPILLNDSSSKEYVLLENLIKDQWNNMTTQREAFLAFVGDYFNSVGAGLIMHCDTGVNPTKYSWSISQVANAESLMGNLMELTDGCLHPGENFKDSQGIPVGMAFSGSYRTSGLRHRDVQEILDRDQPTAILSSDAQQKDSSQLMFCMAGEKFLNVRFPITRKG